MDHLLTVMKKPDERESGFMALGEMASAVGGELHQYLPVIMVMLREAVCGFFLSPSLVVSNLSLE
jgi:FKBP12-rapamycin complex-associated protein